MKSLGLDVHAASFTLAVVGERGQLITRRTSETTALALIDAVKDVVGPKTVIVEECHLAQWVKRILSPHVDKLVVCDPQRNAWIAKADFNDDASSAEKLAKLHRGGFIKEIVHPDDPGARLRGLFVHYYDLNCQLTRFKNKLKATFRQEAIPTAGSGIYAPEDHAKWLKMLKHQKHLEFAARQRFDIVDLLQELKDATSAEMIAVAKKNRAFKIIDTIPGAGPVLTTGYLAMIDTPHRFSKKNKLWSYAGLGNKLQTSDQEVYADHASANGNRVLKWVVIEHFMHAVEIGRNNHFRRQYELLTKRGLDHTGARRQVCRALLSTVRSMWMKGEAYRD